MNAEDEDQELFEQATAPTSETTEAEPAPDPVEAEAPVEAQAETQAEAEPEPEPVTPEPEQAAEQASEEPDAEVETPKGGVPPHRLRETTARAQKAEAELEDERKANRQLQQQLAQLQTHALQPQQQPQDQAKEPDPAEFWTDPEAYRRDIEQKFDQRLRQTEVDMSLRMAERTYGDEYKAAYDGLLASGDSNAARAVMNAPDPGETLVQMHRRQKLLAETGGDLEGYRERLRAELLSDPDFLKTATEAARATAQTKTASGVPHLNIPQSVNSGTRAADARPATSQYLSDEELFAQNT